MSYEFDISRQQISVNGRVFFGRSFQEEKPEDFFLEELSNLYSFLHEWFNQEKFVELKTSGSTGKPKRFRAQKEKMMRSAAMTCSFLGLKKGDTALLCLRMDYIAGKMMVVRALVAGLDLLVVPVTGNPLRQISQVIDFAALIPLQVFNSLQVPAEKKRLSSVKHLIIGGGAIDPETEKRLAEFPHAIYASYGMTETLSHIALRRLNGEDASDYYTPLDGVKVSLSMQSTLVIDAPFLSDEILETNDIVEFLPTSQFKVLGRVDNVINSGGVKIQIEELEKQLYPFLGDTFAFTSLPDVKFGEIVVLVTTKPLNLSLLERLPAYSQPKTVIQVETLPYTETGKIDRVSLKQMVQK